MPDVVLLDAGPLGMASHPRPSSEILAWMSRHFAAGVELLVPEIADYEVRRDSRYRTAIGAGTTAPGKERGKETSAPISVDQP